MLFFSDFDGTLLDGDPVGSAAGDRLASSRRVAQVVVASSRSIEDLVGHFTRWGWTGDCIGENGAQIAVRDPVLTQRLVATGFRLSELGDYHVFATGRSTEEWITALPPKLLRGAQVQRGSALLRSAGVADREPELREACREAGLHIARGGDWLAIWDGDDKGTAASRYAEGCTFAAIGNAENDRSLLERARPGFVIRNPGSGHDASLASLPGAVLMQRVGAEGWDEALEQLRLMGP